MAEPRDAELLDGLLRGSLFFVAFVVAYLAVPFNPMIPGTSLQLRPEPIVLILALPFGRSGVLGASGGVLAHDIAFRLGPEITPFFTIAQTAAALAAGLVAASVWMRVRPPLRWAAVPAVFAVIFIPVLGLASAFEIHGPVAEEMLHIFDEVLVPQLLLGPLALAAWDYRGAILRAVCAKAGRGSD